MCEEGLYVKLRLIVPLETSTHQHPPKNTPTTTTITTTTTIIGFSLFERQRVWPGDGVSIQECEKTPEGLEKGPVGEEADALVAMDTPGSVVEVGLLQAQLGALPVGQALLGVRLVELDGCPVHLQENQKGCARVFSDEGGVSRNKRRAQMHTCIT